MAKSHPMLGGEKGVSIIVSVSGLPIHDRMLAYERLKAALARSPCGPVTRVECPAGVVSFGDGNGEPAPYVFLYSTHPQEHVIGPILRLLKDADIGYPVYLHRMREAVLHDGTQSVNPREPEDAIAGRT